MDYIGNEDIDLFKLELFKKNLYGTIEPSNNEFEIMDFVSNTIEDIKLPTNIKEDNLDNALTNGILSLVVFNKKYINKIKRIPLVTYDDLEDNDLRSIIKFNIFSKFKKIGKVLEIKVPNNVSSVSKIWIGHEYIHCLKDTNYNEFILKNISSEVLPLFYEMLITHTLFKNDHNFWKQCRLSFLSNHNEVYKKLEKLSLQEDRYKILRYSYGQYLTSYYYALNLFNLYKQDSALITKEINKVLDHKQTTLDLLKKLNIYKFNQEHVKIYNLEHQIV